MRARIWMRSEPLIASAHGRVHTRSGCMMRPGLCTTSLTRFALAQASIWSRLTFMWCSGILAVGSKRSLEHEDLYELQNVDSTAHNSELLAAAWRREERSGRRSFIRAFHRAFGAYFWKTVSRVTDTSRDERAHTLHANRPID